MNCPKCGTENDNDAKFCRSCGETLKSEPQDKNKKIIIIGLIALVIILTGAVLYAGGVFKEEIPLKTEDFELFKMDIPVGSYFEEFTSIPAFGNIGGLVYMENKGQYSYEVSGFGVSKMGASIPSQMKFEREDGAVKIFKDKENTGLYMVALTKDDFFFSLMGRDVDTMIKMIKSIEITDPNGLASQSTSSSTSSASAPASSTPSSISILGGSFSTGSDDADKTYARINVGTQHAGENVIVQIYYSRDGNNLNNGNMVPATVHSDGYLEISSADAYKYYPDHATINIYDSNSKLLTSTSVNLSPTSGTQTF